MDLQPITQEMVEEGGGFVDIIREGGHGWVTGNEYECYYSPSSKESATAWAQSEIDAWKQQYEEKHPTPKINTGDGSGYLEMVQHSNRYHAAKASYWKNMTKRFPNHLNLPPSKIIDVGGINSKKKLEVDDLRLWLQVESLGIIGKPMAFSSGEWSELIRRSKMAIDHGVEVLTRKRETAERIAAWEKSAEEWREKLKQKKFRKLREKMLLNAAKTSQALKGVL